AQNETHRLGDYFAAIRLLPVEQDPSAFHLLFHRLPSAGRYWKDLMVNILQEIEKAPEQPSITLGYKGDNEPSSLTASRVPSSPRRVRLPPPSPRPARPPTPSAAPAPPAR